MKQRIAHTAFQLILRILLKILSLLALAGRGIAFFISRAARTSCVICRIVLPVVLFFYFPARKLKARLVKALAPLRGHAFYVLGHRYFVHGLIVLIVGASAAPSLQAASGSTGGTFGETTLLRTLYPTEAEEEIVLDETLPAEELESYLEGRFQNQQPIAGELASPTILDGSALKRLELPGLVAPVVRTEIVEYEVTPGDTVWAIAEKFGVSVATMLWENKLSLWSTIRPGQKLSILPVSGVTHTVRRGETVSAIAKRYGAAANEIQEINQLTDATELAVGAKIVVPGGRPPAAAPTPAVRRELKTPPSIAATPGGKLLWPVISKRITQYFKWRHAGLDIGDKTDQPIYAAENGVVEISGWGRGGWGYTVLVNHGGGLKTRYAHASKVLVRVGEEVKKGQAIALVGSTGRSTGPHLHFGVYTNGRPVNPLDYLR